ncbi:MAG: hypothetical protein AB7Q37_00875 [Pyrinomonadaceae bacterium]
MYCPNCGEEDRLDQNYCRSCGLKLDAISNYVSEQFPTEEFARFQRRKAIFEKLSLLSISVSGCIAFAVVMVKAAIYKMLLFGEELILGSAIVALFAFALLSAILFGYSRLFMRFKTVEENFQPKETVPGRGRPTSKLIEDRPFEPVQTVTEDTTDLLLAEKRPRGSSE